MILLVAVKERQVRIAVGCGLEATLTDAVTKAILDEAVLPRMRASDVAGGLEAGVDAMVLRSSP